MRRPASILWHSASVNGCDLRPHPTYVDAPFGASKTLFYMCHPKWPKTPSDPLVERKDVIRSRNLGISKG